MASLSLSLDYTDSKAQFFSHLFPLQWREMGRESYREQNADKPRKRSRQRGEICDNVNEEDERCDLFWCEKKNSWPHFITLFTHLTELLSEEQHRAVKCRSQYIYAIKVVPFSRTKWHWSSLRGLTLSLSSHFLLFFWCSEMVMKYEPTIWQIQQKEAPKMKNSKLEELSFSCRFCGLD